MSNDTVFALPAELTLYTAAALREGLLAWSAFAGDEAWTLDAAAVDSVDAAGVQLLLALSCSARAHGATLALMALLLWQGLRLVANNVGIDAVSLPLSIALVYAAVPLAAAGVATVVVARRLASSERPA